MILCASLLVCCIGKKNNNFQASSDEHINNSYPESCFNIEQVKDFQNMLMKDQYLRQMMSKIKFSKSQSDSIWELQKELDKENTEKLINITGKCGFPYPDRINAPIPLWLIFQHADLKHAEKIKLLLKTELELNNIGFMEYKMIMWHLNGRKLEEFPGNPNN